MPIKIRYYIVLFVPFFLLLYSESLVIGGLRISQLWKIPLLGFIIFYLFQNRHRSSPAWTQSYYWLSIKRLVNSGCIKNFVGNVMESIFYLFLPLLYNFFQNVLDKDYVRKILLCVSQYLILTNIPFLFFGLATQKQGLAYGDMTAYTGIFQNQHAMSTIMGICIVIILFFLKEGYFENWKSKLYNLLLLPLAGYAMYLGFARTGWAMCVLGMVILFFPRNLGVKQWIGVSFVLAILIGGLSFMMETNSDFRDRILDIDSVSGRQKEIGSGRGEYMANALELYASGNTFELFFGKSMEELAEYEHEQTGLSISAHNGFITLLATDGIIGVFIKLAAMGLLLSFIYKRRNCSSYNAALAFWFMNLSYQLTQGGHVFHSDLLYALMFCYLQFEYEEQNDLEKV